VQGSSCHPGLGAATGSRGCGKAGWVVGWRIALGEGPTGSLGPPRDGPSVPPTFSLLMADLQSLPRLLETLTCGSETCTAHTKRRGRFHRFSAALQSGLRLEQHGGGQSDGQRAWKPQQQGSHRPGELAMQGRVLAGKGPTAATRCCAHCRRRRCSPRLPMITPPARPAGHYRQPGEAAGAG
jgi:hypothetical protein